jgi:DNA-binding response OmpR family regulator
VSKVKQQARPIPSIVIDVPTFSARAGGRLVPLTTVQFDMLRFLVEHDERVVSHGEIAKEVLARTCGDTALLVRVHICHLRRALGPSGILISTVRGRGYRVQLR